MLSKWLTNVLSTRNENRLDRTRFSKLMYFVTVSLSTRVSRKKPSLLIDYERSVKIWMYTLPLSPQLMEKKLLERNVSLIVNRSLRHREMLQTWFIKRKFNNTFILCIRIEDEISHDNFYQCLYAIVVGMLPTRKQEKCSFQRSPGYWNRIMYQF